MNDMIAKAAGVTQGETSNWGAAATLSGLSASPQMQSQGIGKLAEALAKAQGSMEGAKKETENTFYKSSYADLASCWTACRKALSSNGLAVIQTLDGMSLRTILAHSSGEWIASVYPIRPVKEDPQGLGSAISYSRRYSLCAIVGIAPEGEDDDGEQASGRDTITGPRRKETVTGQAPIPACPKCGQTAPVMRDQYKAGGFFCYPKSNRGKGCGAKWGGPGEEPGAAEAAEAFE